MAKQQNVTRISVGLGSCGVAAGARAVYDAFKNKLSGNGADVELKPTGCVGMCYREVLVDVETESGERLTYCDVTP